MVTVSRCCLTVLQQCASPESFTATRATCSSRGSFPAMNLFRLPSLIPRCHCDWQILLPRAVTGTAAEVIGVRPEHLELGGAGTEMDVDRSKNLGGCLLVWPNRRRLRNGPVNRRSRDGRGPPERVVWRETCTGTPASLRRRRASATALVSTARVDLCRLWRGPG